MHPDQEIFHPSKCSKIAGYLAIAISLSVFGFFIYGFYGKHLGTTTEKIVEHSVPKEKSKKFAHVKGYVADSKKLNK